MRILHTSDWHLGRTLEGRSREDEQRAAVQDVCRIALEQRAALVLIAGDLYDSTSPPTWAQELFYAAATRLTEQGVLVVVISGNHDSPDGLCAASPLALRHGIYLLGRPSPAASLPSEGRGFVSAQGNALRLAPPLAQEEIVIAALPYVSEGRMRRLFTSSMDGEARDRSYSEAICSLLRESAAAFDEQCVNIIAAHLFARHAKVSGDERHIEGVGGSALVDLSEFPFAQYVALGHLHRPQQAAQNAWYSGSLLQQDFGEGGRPKQVLLVDAIPGGEVRVTPLPITGGHKLLRWQCGNFEQALLRAQSDEEREAWLELSVTSPSPLLPAEITALRRERPRLINILWQPEGSAQVPSGTLSWRTSSPEEIFRGYYQARRGLPPSEELTQCFVKLMEGDFAHETDTSGV